MKRDVIKTRGRTLSPREITAKYIWEMGGDRTDIAAALNIKLKSVGPLITTIRGKGWPLERRRPTRGSSFSQDVRTTANIIKAVQGEFA